jgi:hypothetical protein
MAVVNFIRIAALVFALAAAGCGGMPTDRPTPGQPQATGQNVPGQPRKTDAGNVPTAPISIPSTNAWQQDPIDVVRQRLERLIRDQCGGQLCVNIVVRQGDDDSYDQCQFASTIPDTSEPIVLKPGSTLTLLTGMWPCEETSDQTTAATTQPQPTPQPTTNQPTTNVRPTG